MTSNLYDATAALTSYYASRTATRPARLWATEKLVQDLAAVGIIELFEGSGTNPTSLTGYGIDKLWLQVSDGVTDAPGTIRAYDGAGSASDVANWPALTQAGFASYITGGQVEYIGTWNASTNTPTLVSSQGTKGYYYVVSTAGSTTLDSVSSWSVGDWAIYNGTVWQKVSNAGGDGIVSVKDYGATGNGSTDDYAAVAAAVASGAGTIYFPSGTYRLSQTLVLSSAVRLIGAGRTLTTLAAAHTSGAVIEITAARCAVTDMAISSLSGSARRTASPLGKSAPDATVDGKSLNRGIYVNGKTTAATFTTLERLEVVYQPGDGINWQGAGSGSAIRYCGINTNGGHGIYMDDGDRDGSPGSTGRPGIIDITRNIIQLNWGQGIALGTESSTTVYRIELTNNDVFTNCVGDGGTNQPSFFLTYEADVAIRGENCFVSHNAFGFNDVGLVVSESSFITGIGNRFISNVTWGALIGAFCSCVTFQNSHFDGPPTLGFRVFSDCDNIRIDGLDLTELSSVIDAESECLVVLNGKRCYTVPGSSSLFYADEVKAATIASGTLNVQSGIVDVSGEGDTTDSVNLLRFASGIAVPDGYKTTIVNREAYTITVQDRTLIGGSANVELDGQNFALAPGDTLGLVSIGGVFYSDKVASPTFITPLVTSIHIGSSDTTVARVAAGRISVEGNEIAQLPDLAATTTGKGASLIGIEDSGSYFSATTVETALAYLGSSVAALDQAVVLKGTWDASAGTFPGSGVAQSGWSYIVSVGGTVNSVVFVAGDRIVAITDNASTSTYASNWHKLDYTDQVSSVAGKTGAVTIQVADVTDMSANGRSLVSAADYAAMKALLDLEIGTDVQAYDVELAAIAGASSAADKVVYYTGPGTAALADFTSTGRSIAAAASQQAASAAVGTWYVIAQSSVAVTRSSLNDGSDATEGTLVTVTIPAGAMGANGRLRVTSLWSYTNSATSKTPRIRFSGASGTAYLNTNVTTTQSMQVVTQICNRNSVSSQVGATSSASAAGGWGAIAAAPTTSAADTSASTSVVFRCLWGTASVSGESITLESYTVELFYAA